MHLLPFPKPSFIKDPGPGAYRTTKNTWNKKASFKKFKPFTQTKRFQELYKFDDSIPNSLIYDP